MKSRFLRSLSVLAAALVCASCQLRAALTVVAAPNGGGLEFNLTEWGGAKPGELLSVTVHRCATDKSSFPGRGELAWKADVAAGVTGPLAGKFLYGQDLGALHTSGRPSPLEAGCYVVTAYAKFPDPRAAVLVFDIQGDGNVVARAAA